MAVWLLTIAHPLILRLGYMPHILAGMIAKRRYARGIESMFLWQNVGGSLLTLAPAITYSLKVITPTHRTSSQ